MNFVVEGCIPSQAHETSYNFLQTRLSSWSSLRGLALGWIRILLMLLLDRVLESESTEVSLSGSSPCSFPLVLPLPFPFSNSCIKASAFCISTSSLHASAILPFPLPLPLPCSASINRKLASLWNGAMRLVECRRCEHILMLWFACMLKIYNVNHMNVLSIVCWSCQRASASIMITKPSIVNSSLVLSKGL